MNENTCTSMENAIGEIKVTPNRYNSKIIYEKSDSIFAILYMLLGFTFIRFFWFYDWRSSFKFALAVYTVAYVTVVIFYAKAKGREIQKETVFWILVMSCIALFFKTENFFTFIIQIMVAAYFTGVTGGLYGGGTSSYIYADLIHIAFVAPFTHFFSIFPAISGLFKRKEKEEKVQIHPAVWGAVMSVAALRVIIPLLIKADSNFLIGTTEFIDHLFAGMDLFSAIVNVCLSVPVACYLYSLAFCCINNTGRIFEKEELDTHRHRLRISPAITLKVFICTICFVYILFIALQAEYLLGAFAGKLYIGYTYAEYARTGFFELCKVSVINLSLLAISNLLIKKEENKCIKPPMLVLCILSLLLLSTAMAKMVMYIAAYGLTVKRVISTVFLLWLVVVFVMCIIRLYKPFNLVKTAVLTGTVMFCVLFSFDIGMESHKFNEKYGFEEKTVQFETVFEGTVYLPVKSEIFWINVTHSENKTYSYSLSDINKFYRIMQNADYTDLSSVQDFPMREEYYIITIYPDMYENKPDVVIYCYEKDGQIFLEQPYNGIWTIKEDLLYMFDNYRF